MKIVRLSKAGISPAKITTVTAKSGRKYFAVLHGEEGRGRWEYRFPLGAKDFPFGRNRTLPFEKGEPDPTSTEFSLVNLNRSDARDNDLYLLGAGRKDQKFLVFWRLSPGFRGGATFEITGNARLLG